MATPEDIPAIAAIDEKTFNAGKDDAEPKEVYLRWIEKIYHRWMAKNPQVFFVLRNSADKVVGFAALLPMKKEVMDRFVRGEIGMRGAEIVFPDHVETSQEEQTMTTTQDIRQAVHQVMPAAIDHLKQLVSIPSIATQGYPREQVLEAARVTEAQLRAVGFQQVHQLEELAGGYPAVYGEIEGPPGTSTVLLYAHYDVQPPGQAGMG